MKNKERQNNIKIGDETLDYAEKYVLGTVSKMRKTQLDDRNRETNQFGMGGIRQTKENPNI